MMILGSALLAQIPKGNNEILGANLVPNPSFEKYSATPIGWFYKGEQYTRVMKYWMSPTAASPDVFGSRVLVPKYWSDKGFGKDKPRTGQSMSGITTYGCKGKKTHCREYIAIRLNESLVPGQTYNCKMYALNLRGSVSSNNLGFSFVKKLDYKNKDILLDFDPQYFSDEIININNGWQLIEGNIIANESSNFLIIGNFKNDENTLFSATEDGFLTYAYYYIDDVSIRKVPPFLPVPLADDDLSKVEVKEGNTFILKDIYFDFDDWDLHPRSYIELNKLLNILREHPSMRIEIIGHTDSIGEYGYNDILSQKRAERVVDYLIEQRINTVRLNFIGKGERYPIESNIYESGRSMNRRVEFKVIEE